MEPKVASPAGGAKEPRVNASAGSSEKRSLSSSHAPSYSKRIVSDAIAPRQPEPARAAFQIDMNLEISHRWMIRLIA
jgi:hypothetical protein